MLLTSFFGRCLFSFFVILGRDELASRGFGDAGSIRAKIGDVLCLAILAVCFVLRLPRAEWPAFALFHARTAAAVWLKTSSLAPFLHPTYYMYAIKARSEQAGSGFVLPLQPHFRPVRFSGFFVYGRRWVADCIDYRRSTRALSACLFARRSARSSAVHVAPAFVCITNGLLIRKPPRTAATLLRLASGHLTFNKERHNTANGPQSRTATNVASIAGINATCASSSSSGGSNNNNRNKNRRVEPVLARHNMGRCTRMLCMYV